MVAAPAVLLGALAPDLRGWAALLAAAALAVAFYGWLVQRRSLEEATDQADLQERGLRELEAEVLRHRTALDELADGLDLMVFLCDADGTVLYANPRAIRGFRFEQPTGRTILAVTLSTELDALVRAAARERAPQRVEFTLAHPEELVGIAKAWTESPEHQRVFVTVQDITGLRRLERVRRDFVANVSHELRTPMTTIRTMAETLQDPEVERPMVERFLAQIIAEVDRLTHITEDLLTLSVAESRDLSPERVDLAQLAREVVEQMRPKAQAKGVDLEAHTPDQLVAQVSPGEVRQVILNLLDNALNYTHEGTVALVLSESGGEAVLEVRDTGIGIAREHVPRLFERFYRVDKGRSRATGGTGLGLAIVRHLVEAHGGTVGVESELNKGSTFTVRLPIG